MIFSRKVFLTTISSVCILHTTVCNINTNMLKNLISSQTRILLLKKFLLNPDREFYLRELSSYFKISPRSVSLELQNLEQIGLIQRNVHGKNHFFHVNKNHLLYTELQSIIVKTVGVSEKIASHLEKLKKKITWAFIYGSYADGNFTTESDIDLLVIGDVDPLDLSKQMSIQKTNLNREINFTVMSLDEFRNRIQRNDHFINQVMTTKKIFILGNKDDFEQLGRERLA